MKVHVFQDSLGHYAIATYRRLKRLDGTQNSFQVINVTDDLNCKTVDGITMRSKDWLALASELATCEKGSTLYFHCYNYNAQFVLEKLKQQRTDLTFNWVFWSGEFYNLPEFLHKLYIGDSKKFLPKRAWHQLIRIYAHHWLEKLQGRTYYLHRDFIKSFKHINGFYGLLPSDFNQVMSYSGAKMAHLPFAYQSFAMATSSYVEPRVRELQAGVRIMLNHSGDPTLNHVDAIERLMSLKGDLKLILPLAYGNKEYIAEVKERGANAFGPNKVEVWDEFLPVDVYALKLQTIDVAIFNAMIQQGVGNILPLLYNGTKVFFRNENGMFHDLKHWGFHVFSIQDDLNAAELFTPLNIQQINENRQVLNRYFSEEAIDLYYQQMVN